tara:strand:- start:2881 stop:4371 length:1491 start_codon:yes stop_codon:yes gene_type:complete
MTENSKIYDLLVIGGGINGVGIAADAAGRGLDVVLCESNDLASATSSASTKLIHGGLRYLEQYEFSLVRKALAEREVLLRNAPHIITPLRFQLPHRPHLRPRWMIRAGLYLYDFLSKRITLPASRSLRFGPDSPLVASLRNGFEYSDAWVDDARLVVMVAKQAEQHGAQILVRKKCVEASEEQGGWRVSLMDTRTGLVETLRARALVNAAGPWVEIFSNAVLPQKKHEHIRLVKGCHIVVPRMFASPEAFLLQNSDGRVVFVIPYEQDFTLIGTTEEDLLGDPASAKISAWEIDYLVEVTNEYFKTKITKDDVLHVFAGVRPLMSDEEESASEVSRDYTIALDTTGAPLLTIYGGKITTYRRLAESASEKLREIFSHMKGDWTEHATLPGGDFESQAKLSAAIALAAPWLPASIRQRWVGSYGTLSYQILAATKGLGDLGQDFGHGLSAREVDYLCSSEWAEEADDILWRRTKLGLLFSADQKAQLEDYLARRHPT